jgi:hypothetical protein
MNNLFTAMMASMTLTVGAGARHGDGAGVS